MKDIIYIIIGVLCLLFYPACEKDKLCPVEETTCSIASQYVPLAIGNYWIYEFSSYDPFIFTGTITNHDTVRVIADTTIRTHQYFMIEEDRWLSFNTAKDTTYWRDSLGYIVDLQGAIQFTATDFDRILKLDEFIGAIDRRTEYSVKDSVVLQITPAGNFNCLDFRGRFFFNNVESPDYVFHNCFAKDIGLVYKNYFYISSPFLDYRRKLSEYHLED